MHRRSFFYLLAVALMAAACATPAAPSANPTSSPAAPSPNPSTNASPPLSEAPASAGTITLRPAPAGLGCDAMPVEYRRVTFQIDPSADEQVTVQTDTGKSLQTFWSAGFEGSAQGIKDPSGQVVAANGETLDIPEGALPRLHGYFVCPSGNALYVLLQDPT